MLDFPLESAAPTKANILKHRLAQLYDYATHPWPALILKITKKKRYESILLMHGVSWVDGGFSFISYPALRGPQHKLASLGVISTSLEGMFYCLAVPLTTSLAHQENEILTCCAGSIAT